MEVEPRLDAVVKGSGQRPAPDPEHRPRQRGEVARQPQHSVDEGGEPFFLAPDVGLGDLRHEQNGKAAQQAKGKGEQRQGHPLQAAVLGHGSRPPALLPQVERKAGRDEKIFCRVEGAGKAPPALHGPEDLPQPTSGVGGAGGSYAAKAAPGFPEIERPDPQGRKDLTEGGSGQNGGTLGPVVQPLAAAPLQQDADDPDAQGLLGQLAHHVGGHPPPGDEKAPQHRRDGHPRQAKGGEPQCRSGPRIPQPPPGGRARQPKLRRPRKCAQRRTGPKQPHQHPPGGGTVRDLPCAQLFGHEAGGRNGHARRGQRDKKGVDRQHQLIQPHALPAQRLRQIDAQPHPGQPQHHVRPGHKGCIFQVALPHGALLPSFHINLCGSKGRLCALQNRSGGVGCFRAGFMVS